MNTVIGPYRVVSRLGQGRTGEVFLARDPDGRQVAVKVVHPRLAADPAFRRRFQQEAEAASRVARSCTAPILDIRLDDGQVYLVTEYVDGPDLRRRVTDHGPLSGSGLETLAVSTAVALQAVHAAGLVHQDLKPSGILLGPLGPRVIGFGVAHLADPTGPAGEEASLYISPERARGEEATAASDVFAWGGVVLYAATGRQPSGGGTGHPDDHAGPGPTGLHGVLHDLVGRALARDPGRRPGVPEILRALTGASDPATSLVRPPTAAGEQPVEPFDAPTNPAIPLVRPPAPPVAAVPPALPPLDVPTNPAVPLTRLPSADPPAVHPPDLPAAHPDGLPTAHPNGLATAHPDGLPAAHPDGLAAGEQPPHRPGRIPGGGGPGSPGAAPPRWGRSVAAPVLAGVAIALVIAAVSFFLPRDGATGDREPLAQPAATAGDAAGPTPETTAGTVATLSPSPQPTPSSSTATATATPTPERIWPFRDDFTGEDRGWSVAAWGKGKGRHRPTGGAYRITARSDGYLPVAAPLAAPVKNATITAKVQVLNGTGTFGVFCRGRDAGARRYEFSISSGGDASIVKSGEAPASVKRVPVPGFRPARLNVLQASCLSGKTGTRLSLRVNGRGVVSRLDRERPFASGSIGVFARAQGGGSGVDVGFNSFEARS
ncbi:protein kinase domain-containing protein [Streptosporangium sp. NPDC003464]